MSRNIIISHTFISSRISRNITNHTIIILIFLSTLFPNLSSIIHIIINGISSGKTSLVDHIVILFCDGTFCSSQFFLFGLFFLHIRFILFHFLGKLFTSPFDIIFEQIFFVRLFLNHTK